MLPVCCASLDDIAWGATAILADNVANVIGTVDKSAAAFDVDAAAVCLGLRLFPSN